jgi:hypothetical protein
MSSGRRTPPVSSDVGNQENASESAGRSQEVSANSQIKRANGTDGLPSLGVSSHFSSMTTTPPTGKNGGNHRMNTINSSGKDGYGSDNHPMQPPPTQSMFNSLYEDSDVSDGRYAMLFLVLSFLPSFV